MVDLGLETGIRMERLRNKAMNLVVLVVHLYLPIPLPRIPAIGPVGLPPAIGYAGEYGTVLPAQDVQG